jgi:sugar-specific transcriptional regulator TrmB
MTSVYCEIYGNTIKNKVISYLMENQHGDFAIGDMARELKMSRPKAYEIIDDYIKKGFVNKSRIVGRTQLYKLNMEHQIIKIYIRNFNECIKMVIDEYRIKNTHSTASTTNVGVASTKTR